MDIIINNGAEAEIAVKPTEVITFVGQNGIDGETPDLLDYIKRNEVGDLAFDDLIELAKLGTTIIQGGYIKTVLIDVNAIRVQGALATVDEATALANIAAALALTDFSGTLGDLAFENLIEASKLGTTIIQGGYIKSNLLDVNAIRVQGGLALEEDAALAIQTAAAALVAAQAAEVSAAQANIIIGNISSDNILSAFEKPAILKEWQAIQSERPIIIAQAATYSLPHVDYDTAYSNLDIYVSPLVSDIGSDSPIDGAEFRLKFKTYYDAKVTLLKSVSDKAKVLSDEALAEALAAAQAATGAQNAVDALSGSLGELAFENAITLAKLDDTIIQGGYIKTTLIDVSAIRVEGDFATTTTVADAIAAQGLGDLAFEDLVGLAKLDSTVIVGGYIKTSLIDADYIKSDIIDANYIISLGIVSSSISTNTPGNKRVEITDTENNIRLIGADNKDIVVIDDDSAIDGYYSNTTPPVMDGDGNPPKNYLGTDGAGTYNYATLGPGITLGGSPSDGLGYLSLSKKRIHLIGEEILVGDPIDDPHLGSRIGPRAISSALIDASRVNTPKIYIGNIAFGGAYGEVYVSNGDFVSPAYEQGATGTITYKNASNANATIKVISGIITQI